MLFNLGVIGELTDGQLLERFVVQGGEEGELAFAALVERHGPMVWRVSRSMLRDPNDAQDAFQAAFLVLVQKARSLWVRDSLGPWLHRVAHRVAARVRRDAARRIEHERRKAAATPSSAPDAPGDDDLAAMLHDEIERLPSRCREPLILCDVQGLTHHDAARRLGWPLGTVKTRLARARELLRGRLARRNGLPPGLMIAGSRLATAFRNESIAPPGFLVVTTVRAAVAVAAGEAVAIKVISAPVAVLFEEVLKAMFLTKLKIASAIVISAIAAAGVARALAQSGGDEKSGPGAETGRSALTSPARVSFDDSDSARRAIVVKRLGDEALEARTRLDRVVKKLRENQADGANILNDPAVYAANESIDDLEARLDQIDRILREAANNYPTLADFSNDREGPVNGEARDLALLEADATYSRADKRWKWAQRMYQKGYVSLSQLDAELAHLNQIRKQARTARKQYSRPNDGVIP